MRHVAILEKFNYPDFKVSVKASEVFMAVEAYRLLARKSTSRCTWGSPRPGLRAAPSIGGGPGHAADGRHRRYHPHFAGGGSGGGVKVGFEILKSLKLRANGINFIACPSCSRQNFDVISTMNVPWSSGWKISARPWMWRLSAVSSMARARRGRRTWD